ncbi:MAG: GNAT family N-acetyltransferase [Vicinamibacterales bacterium]
MVVLETSRLTLRPPEEADLDAFVDIHEDPEVLSYLTRLGDASGRAAGWRTIALLIGHWALRGYGQWTVVERASGEIIGRVGLWAPEGWPGVELGWIIRRSRWNEGFATEAALAAVDFAFTHTDVTYLISQIRSDNTASIRIAQKLGATLDGRETLDGHEILTYGFRKR